MPGKLYICATPIGNLSDITLRALETLKSVDIIAAEDTRHTVKLLNHFDIKKPLIAFHKFNEKKEVEYLIKELLSGKNIALVSDAGTPLISDPGDFLIRDCIKNNIEIISVPGACAAICALTTSGLISKRFYFYGFLSAKKSEKLNELKSVADFNETLVFYEAPHKIRVTLELMLDTFGNRNITIHREMTKKFEETLRMTLKEAVSYYNETESKGEYVIIVEGCPESEENEYADMSIKEHVDYLIKSGLDKKEAIKKCAEERNVPKREIYNVYNREE